MCELTPNTGGVRVISGGWFPRYGATSSAVSSRLSGRRCIKPLIGANALKAVTPQLLAEGPEPIHRSRCQAVAPAEVLDDLQPFLVVQAHALEDGLCVCRDRAALVVSRRRPAGPVHQLQVVRQGEGDTRGASARLSGRGFDAFNSG